MVTPWGASRCSRIPSPAYNDSPSKGIFKPTWLLLNQWQKCCQTPQEFKLLIPLARSYLHTPLSALREHLCRLQLQYQPHFFPHSAQLLPHETYLIDFLLRVVRTALNMITSPVSTQQVQTCWHYMFWGCAQHFEEWISYTYFIRCGQMRPICWNVGGWYVGYCSVRCQCSQLPIICSEPSWCWVTVREHGDVCLQQSLSLYCKSIKTLCTFECI